MSTLNLPQARIPMGWVMIQGQRVPVEVDQEWARYFFTLTDRAGGVIAPNNLYQTIIQLPQSAVVLESADEGEPGPMGPPGVAGPMGPAGLSMRGMDGEDGESLFMFPPGSGKASIDGANFTGDVSAPKFKTATGSASCPNGVATTVYTLPTVAGVVAMYLVSANIGGVTDVANYSSFAVITTDNTVARIALSNNATLLSITLSGLNIQITQSSGSTQTGNITVTKIG